MSTISIITRIGRTYATLSRRLTCHLPKFSEIRLHIDHQITKTKLQLLIAWDKGTWIILIFAGYDSGYQTDRAFHFWNCGKVWHLFIYYVTRVPVIQSEAVIIIGFIKCCFFFFRFIIRVTLIFKRFLQVELIIKFIF